MKTLIRSAMLLGICSAVLSCAQPDSSSVAGSSDGGSTTPPPTNGTTPPTATEASPLQLKISTMYDFTSNVQEHNFTETGTTLCEATDSSPVVTCTVEIPEARLYFSSMNFSFSWRNDKCKLLIFQPYYYQASKAANFRPPWSPTSDIDCTASPTPTSCFGGPAVQLVTGFPTYTANIYITDPDSSTPQQKTETANSGYKNAWGSNRRFANDADPAKLGADYAWANGDSYVANTYVNYSLTCKDDWYDDQTYQINLVVKDVDSNTGGPIDNFFTWKEIP